MLPGWPGRSRGGSSFCRAARSTGLTRWWSKPASLDRRRSSSWPQPVRAIRTTPSPRWLADPARGLVAVQLRQPDVQQHHVRPERRGRARRPPGRRGPSGPRCPPAAAAWPGSRRRPGCRPRPGCGGSSRRRGARRRPPAPGCAAVAAAATGRRTTNSLPLPGPSLCASTRAAVHLDQPLHQRQADAQPALRALQGAVDLGEHLEDAGQHLGRDADAGVPDPDHAPARPPARRSARCGRPRSVYLAALFSRFSSTWASRVGSRVQRGPARGGSVTVSSWPRFVDERPAGLDGAARRPPPGRPAPCGARSCRRLMRDTSSRSSTSRARCCTCRSITSRGPLQLRRRPALGAQDLHGVADRGQRVAQLVGQHRQELVLAPVGLLERRQQVRVLDGDDRAVGQVLRRREVGGVVGPAGLRGHEGEHAERPGPRAQRHADVGLQAQLAEQRRPRRRPAPRCAMKSVGDRRPSSPARRCAAPWRPRTGPTAGAGTGGTAPGPAPPWPGRRG